MFCNAKHRFGKSRWAANVENLFFFIYETTASNVPKASSCLLGVLLCSLVVFRAFVFSFISLTCLVSAPPGIAFVDSPMGLGPCSFLRFSMIFKGLGFIGFLGFVLESQKVRGLPMAGVLSVSLLVRDSPLAGVFLFFGFQ